MPTASHPLSLAGVDPLYLAYHDEEWGVPEWDDRALFEKLVLDGFQAGLSWITILRKRPAFRAAFDGFDPEKIVRYDAAKIEALMADAGIVRNRAKIAATIALARIVARPQCEHGGFARHLVALRRRRPIQNQRELDARDRRADRGLRRRSSKDLRRAARNFVGPTIIYAFMQATGMVNDHLVDCHRHAACRALRRRGAGTGPPARVEPRAWQRMLSGRRLDLIDPSPLDIEIADIAHGLARVARWNGQTGGAEIFSVAQHSLLVEALFAALAPQARRGRATRRAAARCAGICDRRHDLAVQGGDRRRLQAVEARLLAAIIAALRPAGAGAAGAGQGDQGGRPGGGLFRGDGARRLHRRRGAQVVRRAQIRARGLRALSAAGAAGARRKSKFLRRFAELDGEARRARRTAPAMNRTAARCRASTSVRSR